MAVNGTNFEIINLSVLAEKSGIGYQKLYKNLISKERHSLTQDDKNSLVNALFNEASKSFRELGVTINIGRSIKRQ